MTELERQLMTALKEWGEQYEQGQQQQAGQVTSLSKQVSSLATRVQQLSTQYAQEREQQAEQVGTLAGQVEALLRQVNSLAADYKKIATALIAIHKHLSKD